MALPGVNERLLAMFGSVRPLPNWLGLADIQFFG